MWSLSQHPCHDHGSVRSRTAANASSRPSRDGYDYSIMQVVQIRSGCRCLAGSINRPLQCRQHKGLGAHATATSLVPIQRRRLLSSARGIGKRLVRVSSMLTAGRMQALACISRYNMPTKLTCPAAVKRMPSLRGNLEAAHAAAIADALRAQRATGATCEHTAVQTARWITGMLRPRCTELIRSSRHSAAKR